MKKIIDKFNLLLSDEEKKSRMKICDACEFEIMKLGEKMCSKCSCFLKYKVMLKPTGCPIEKW